MMSRRRVLSRAGLFRVAAVGTLVALLHLVPSDAAAQGDPHLRVTDRGLKALLEAGVERSPTLAALIADVEAASIVAYIECDMRLPSRILARLNLITSIGGIRYVRIAVDCAIGARRQMALLAHEIKHALEIAERRDIEDAEAMESFYEDVGFQTTVEGTHRNYETDAAIAVQRQVENEIRRRARPADEAAGARVEAD